MIHSMNQNPLLPNLRRLKKKYPHFDVKLMC